MRLQSFRVQNFRSVVDSGWKDLSKDNITGLIGQNEAGKTSILEALQSFSTGKIKEEVLRSDETLPGISCSFSISPEDLQAIKTKFPNLTPEIEKKVASTGRINLTRKWEKRTVSKMMLEDAELAALFELPEASNKQAGEGGTEGGEQPAPKPKPPVSKLDFENYVSSLFPKFVFFENFSSLLPDSIDVEDITSENTTAEGYMGVLNLIEISNLNLQELVADTDRFAGTKTDKASASLTTNFRDFWRQKIGKSNKIAIEIELKHHRNDKPEKAGKPYLSFWIKDGDERLHPKQRSSGVRWFTSFYLQLKASSKQSSQQQKFVFLIDEPGGNLHARAQEDVLKVFEDIKDKVQIIYTTHSPFLLKLETVYRILAIQRKDVQEEGSETLVFSANELASASTDTLTPLLSLMGANFSDQQVIQKDNNVLLEEISAMYYLMSFVHLFPLKKEARFVPATGVTNIPLFVNLFLGWGIDFIVVVDDDGKGRDVFNQLAKDVFMNDQTKASEKMYKLKDTKGIEDVFSKDTFKAKVLNSTTDFSEINSQYAKNLSKGLLALDFWLKVKAGTITLSDLDPETKKNIENLLKEVEKRLN